MCNGAMEGAGNAADRLGLSCAVQQPLSFSSKSALGTSESMSDTQRYKFASSTPVSRRLWQER